MKRSGSEICHTSNLGPVSFPVEIYHRIILSVLCSVDVSFYAIFSLSITCKSFLKFLIGCDWKQVGSVNLGLIIIKRTLPYIKTYATSIHIPKQCRKYVTFIISSLLDDFEYNEKKMIDYCKTIFSERTESKNDDMTILFQNTLPSLTKNSPNELFKVTIEEWKVTDPEEKRIFDDILTNGYLSVDVKLVTMNIICTENTIKLDFQQNQQNDLPVEYDVASISLSNMKTDILGIRSNFYKRIYCLIGDLWKYRCKFAEKLHLQLIDYQQKDEYNIDLIDIMEKISDFAKVSIYISSGIKIVDQINDFDQYNVDINWDKKLLPKQNDEIVISGISSAFSDCGMRYISAAYSFSPERFWESKINYKREGKIQKIFQNPYLPGLFF
jgi:hypothetical protein